MKKLITYSCNHARLVLSVFVILTLILAFFAFQVDIDADITNLMPENDEVAELIRKYNAESDQVGSMILAVRSDNPYTLEKLHILYEAIEKIEKLPGVMSAHHVFNFLTFKNKGGRISLGYFLEKPAPPKNAEELTRFVDALLSDPFARNQVVSADGKILTLFFPLNDATIEQTVKEVRWIKKDLQQHFDVYVTGDNFFTVQTTEYLLRDLLILLSLAAAVIIIFYYLGFRSKRAILLPLFLILADLIWTLGFMKIAGYPMTLICIILPPLLLTIGSSYTIHILNAFYREARTELETKTWIIDAVSHVTRTVILAGLTTITGFSSLLITSLSQTRQFGLSMSVGIGVCVMFSLFFFPAALTVMPPPKEYQKKHVIQGRISRIMEQIGRGIMKTRYLYIPLFVGTLILFIILIPGLKRQTDYLDYFPDRDPLIEDTMFLIKNLGGTQMMNVTFTAPGKEKNYFLSTEVLSRLSTFEEEIMKNENILSTTSFTNYLKGLSGILFGRERLPDNRGLILTLSRYFKMLTKADSGNSVAYLASQDFDTLTYTFRVYDHATGKYFTEDGVAWLVGFFEDTIDKTVGNDVPYELWDPSLRYLNLSRIMNRDQLTSIGLSLVLIFIIASVFFRSPVYGMLSLVPVLFGVAVNFICMVLFDIPLDMITLMVSSVTIGVGVDDAIHFLIQLKRQIHLGPGRGEEIFHHTFSIAGRPILLTTITIVGGLAVLTASSFKAVSFFGVLLCVTLVSTFLGTMCILPAFARMFLRKDILPGKR